ncbi:MAG: glycosyltransferase family 39 protein [Nanoarchaeota archaeon]
MKQNHAIFFIILIIGTGLRLFMLDSASIRSDEGTTIQVAKELSTYMDSARGDVHPPLSYFYLHLFTLLGDSAFILRLATAIPSILSIVVIFFLAKLVYNEKTGLIAAAILSISQFHVKYAQFVRMYPLFCLFTILATYLFFRIYLKKSGRMEKIAFALTGTALLYTHYYATFLFLFQLIFLIIHKKGRKLLSTVIPLYGIILLLFTPWIPIVFEQFGIFQTPVVADQCRTSGVSLLKPDANNIFIQASLSVFHFTAGLINKSMNLAFILIVLLAVAIIIASAIRLHYDKKTNFFISTLIGTMFLILLLHYLNIITVAPNSRYFLFISPLFYILIAKGISTYRKEAIIGILITLALINAIAFHGYFFGEKTREDWRATTAILNVSEVLIYPPTYSANLHTYYNGTILFVPTLQTYHASLNFHTLFYAIVPVQDPKFCDFPKNDNITLITAGDINIQLQVEACLNETHHLRTLWTNKYKSTWGQEKEDIRVATYVRPTDS